MQVIEQIPDIFLNFVITLAFALIIGIEQKKRSGDEPEAAAIFGTDRSFAFIGALGFILYTLSPQNLLPYIVGFVIVGTLLGIFYYAKIRDAKSYGITSILVALITYTLGPLIITQPKWLSVVIVVAVIILVERKEFLQNISDKLKIDEFTTLAKFLVIAGVILPIVPKSPDIPYINLSAYTIWLTVVVVSSISYASYLLQKFVFKDSGIVISGVLGGLYSSTATTMILAKRSRENDGAGSAYKYASSIVVSSAMMYLRILILIYIFNPELGNILRLPLVILLIVSIITSAGVYYLKRPRNNDDGNDKLAEASTNPLELKAAVLFAALFIFFSVLTHYVIANYGAGGLNVLSFGVGFTDIDPFLLNLFQGKYEIGADLIAKASLQAIISNNILKAIYTFIFAERETTKLAVMGLAVITIVNIILAIVI